MENMQQQFNAAYEEHSEALFRYCFFKLSDRELAKDVLQEAFFRTWRHMVAGNQVVNLKAFLYKTLGNLIIDHYRKRPPDESIETLSEEIGFDPPFDDTGRWIDVIDGTQALGLIQKVKKPYGDVLFMKYVQELSIREIAEIEGVSENTITVRIHRGLGKLKQIFNHEKQ